MLVKLIKYDLMFGAKKFAFMAALSAALIVLTVAGGTLENELLFGLGMFLAVIATITYGVLYVVTSIRHLSSQLCSKESYLGYSLPVSSHTLVLSKFISIIIWGIVTIALVIFFWVVGIGGIMLAQTDVTLKEIWDIMITSMQEIGLSLSNIDSMFSMLLWMGITSSLMSVSLLGFSVVLCNVPFLKERGIGTVSGVVSFLGLSTLISYALGKIGNSFDTSSISNFSGTFDTAARNLSLFYSIAFIALAIVFYFLTVYVVDKHKFIG